MRAWSKITLYFKDKDKAEQTRYYISMLSSACKRLGLSRDDVLLEYWKSIAISFDKKVKEKEKEQEKRKTKKCL